MVRTVALVLSCQTEWLYCETNRVLGRSTRHPTYKTILATFEGDKAPCKVYSQLILQGSDVIRMVEKGDARLR